MTGSISHCSPSGREGARIRPGLGLVLALLIGLLLALPAHAEVAVHRAELVAGEDAYLLSADLGVELNPMLEDVIARGVPLYFVAELEITRPRWYWFDESVVKRALSYRLSYHALTRQYRLSTGALHQSFSTLTEALRVLARIRDWPAVERGALKSGQTYEMAFRLRLDLTQLPKPIQVTAIGARDWNLTSDWLRWAFIVEGR